MNTLIPQTICLLIDCEVMYGRQVQGKVSFTVDDFELSGIPINDYMEVRKIAQQHVESLGTYVNPEARVTNIINLSQIFK